MEIYNQTTQDLVGTPWWEDYEKKGNVGRKVVKQTGSSNTCPQFIIELVKFKHKF